MSRILDLRTAALSLSILTALGLFVGLSGCASYQAKPLDTETQLPENAQALLTTSAVPTQAKQRTEIDFSDGLNLQEISVLAVLNNPELKAKRAQLAVAGAQAFAAGLLPDPQLSYSLDHPTGFTPGLVNAMSLGFGYDIIPLITRQANLRAARHGQTQVRLDLLWQEWQTIQQAKILAVRLLTKAEQIALLRQMRELYLTRFTRSERALQAGDTTLDIHGTDLTALLDSLSQLSQLEQAQNRTQHDLNRLLGLAPSAHPQLTQLSPPAEKSAQSLPTEVAKIVERRPDLMALRAGYASEEARVRAAILSQFPSLGISINRARDTGSVYTSGLSVSLNLPLFSGNRGNIAIARATRQQLFTEYHARIVQTESEIDQIFKLQALLRNQQQQLQQFLPRLQKLVEKARSAYQQGDIDALTFLNMESTWVNKRLEQLSLSQSVWENHIALTTLLAEPESDPFTNKNTAKAKQP